MKTTEAQSRASKNWRKRGTTQYLKTMIKGASKKLVLPTSVTQKALAIIDSNPHPQGKSLNLFALTALYYAIHQSEDCPPISLKDFVDILEVVELKTQIWRTYKQIYWQQKNKPQVCALRPTIYVRRYLAELDADEKVKQIALDLNKRVITGKLHLGKPPSTVAVGIVYISFILDGERLVTQQEIEHISGINQVTIRNSYKRIVKRLGIKVTNANRFRFHREPEKEIINQVE